jgi:hypothetical protein
MRIYRHSRQHFRNLWPGVTGSVWIFARLALMSKRFIGNTPVDGRKNLLLAISRI